MKRPVWMACLCGFVIMFSSVGLASNFAVYLPFALEAGELANHTQTSQLITVRYISSAAVLLFAPYYLKKMGLKKGVLAPLALVGLSYLALGLSGEQGVYYAASAAFGIAYSLAGTVPVTLFIRRQYGENSTAALGVCMAGTGLASVAAPLGITFLKETLGLHRAFLMEGVFFVLVIGFLALCFHDSEAGQRLSENQAQTRAPEKPEEPTARRGELLAFYAALILVGAAADVSNSHFPLFFAAEGYTSGTISLAMSVMGAALICGKILFGRIVDRVGIRKAAYLLFGLLTVGLTLCCVSAGHHSDKLVFAAMLLLGFGLPLTTIGVAAFAKDTSDLDVYVKRLTQFQFCMMLGMMLFGTLPGIIADKTASYLPAFLLFVLFYIIAALLIFTTYARMNKRALHRTGKAASHNA